MKVYVLLVQYDWCGDIVKVFAEKPTKEQLAKLEFTDKEIEDLLEHTETKVNSDDMYFELLAVEVTYD